MKNSYADFHTHTRFSDGRFTMEEMARYSRDNGMYAIGFSDHSKTPFDCGWVMGSDLTEYIAEAHRVKALFEGQIDVLCGLELDYYSELDISGLDYFISSIHFLRVGEKILEVDYSGETIASDTEQYFDGDIFKYTEHYYETASHLADKGACVIGHFDVVTKFNEGGRMFDEGDRRYLDPALFAVEELVKRDAVFEINTGAISRGFRTVPYPSMNILKRISELGGRVILAGDSHNTDCLCHSFDEAVKLAREAGIKNIEKYPPKYEG